MRTVDVLMSTEETSEVGGQRAYSMLSPSIRKRRSGFEGYLWLYLF